MLGLLEPVNTHMYIAQAAGSSPIVNSFKAGAHHVHPVKPDTIVKSIAIGNPADGYYALRIARQSGGGASAVLDEEAIEGIELLAQTEGIFTEATGGVVIGALKKLVLSGEINKNEVTVALITGAGTRTQEIMNDIVKPITVQPTEESFEEALNAQA
jgi:threonine synthase